MPRASREKSKSGMYHVMLRGVNRQDIFHDSVDKQKFMSILSKQNEELHFNLYAYCLMDNHVHMLIKENVTEIEKIISLKEANIRGTGMALPTIDLIMKKIASSYAVYFNTRYGRVGHLFQGRYKSETIETESQFLITLRYIHQNPLKAGIVKDCKYDFSSYSELLRSYEKMPGCFLPLNGSAEEVFPDYVRNYFKLSDVFEEFMNEANNDRLIDIEKHKFSDEEVKNLFIEENFIANYELFKTLDLMQKILMVKSLIEKYDISVNQIARVTGLGRHFIRSNEVVG